MDDKALNPFVFIVGCLRSGTTLLRRMVDAHAQLAIIHETQWVPRWFERRIGITPDGYATAELIDRLLAFSRFAELRIPRERLESLLRDGAPVPYSRFVSAVFDIYGERQNKELVGEKSPGYVRHLPTLHALWPEARIIHLLRDGRDVCLSVLDWKKADRNPGRFSTWSEDPVITAALWWEWHVRQGRAAGRSLGPTLYRELRYEELVADPHQSCAGLCEFLGLPYDTAMLRYESRRGVGSWGRSAKGHWLPPTPGMRDWSTRMSGDDLDRFEATAGEALEEFGYPRATRRPSATARARAARMREAFEREGGAEVARSVSGGDG